MRTRSVARFAGAPWPTRMRWAAIVAAAAVVIKLTAPTPAFAAGPVPLPVLNCIIPSSNGTYMAVFGYSNMGSATTIPIGANNNLTPSSLNGLQPTSFLKGTYVGSFVTPSMAAGQQVTWSLSGHGVTASSTSTSCNQNVSLPAEGNGAGPAVVIAVSTGVALAIVGLRRRRVVRNSVTAAPNSAPARTGETFIGRDA